MTLTELKKAIREEVRLAIREELQEVLTEAITIASTPADSVKIPATPAFIEPRIEKEVREQFLKYQGDPISELLLETEQSMRANNESENYRTAINMDSSMSTNSVASRRAAQMGLLSTEPGINLENLNFLKKASAINKAVVEKEVVK